MINYSNQKQHFRWILSLLNSIIVNKLTRKLFNIFLASLLQQTLTSPHRNAEDSSRSVNYAGRSPYCRKCRKYSSEISKLWSSIVLADWNRNEQRKYVEKKKQEVNLQFLHHDDWPVARYWDIDNQLYSGARAGLELMMTNYFTMLCLIELWASFTVRRGAVELSLVFGFDVLLQGCGLSKCFIAVRTLMRFQTLMDSLDVSPEVTS